MPEGFAGPGGCQTQQECYQYCLNHPEECQEFRPRPGETAPQVEQFREQIESQVRQEIEKQIREQLEHQFQQLAPEFQPQEQPTAPPELEPASPESPQSFLDRLHSSAARLLRAFIGR